MAKDLKRIKDLYQESVREGAVASKKLTEMYGRFDRGDYKSQGEVIGSLVEVMTISDGAQLKLSMAFGLLADYVEQNV